MFLRDANLVAVFSKQRKQKKEQVGEDVRDQRKIQSGKRILMPPDDLIVKGDQCQAQEQCRCALEQKQDGFYKSVFDLPERDLYDISQYACRKRIDDQTDQ